MVKNHPNTVFYRQSLLLSAALVALIGARPAGAQSVAGSGLSGSNGNPISAQSPNWTVGDDLVIAQSGTGTLTIRNGGAVTNINGYIGADSGSQGTVTVTDRDINGNASTWTNTGQLNISDNGTGTLNVQNGGVVNVEQNAVIGLNSDGSNSGVGTILVTGRDANGNASTLNVTYTLSVGDDTQNNQLNIQNGGVVNSGAGTIGDGATGTQGTVTVSGRDANGNASTWNSGNIYVGYTGNGALNIQDGGAVTSIAPGGGAATVYIGYYANSSGAVTVSSTTGALSTLTTSNDVEVGVAGAGVLTIGKGGVVSSGSDVTIAVDSTAAGTLNLDGDATGRGILETSAVNAGAGAVTLNLNGGILRATQDNGNFLNGFAALTVGAGGAYFDTNTHDITVGTDFSGTSSLNKLGLGSLALTGDSSSFTGTTTVAAGTLLVDGSLANSVTSVRSGAILAGTGLVGATTVLTGGTIAPGDNSIGTLHVNGAYTQNAGATYQVLVDPNSNASSRIAVTGTATLANSAVLDVAKTTNAPYILGARYTVLTSTGGLTGTFDVTGDTTTVSPFLTLKDVYDADNAYLVVEQSVPITSVAKTPNQGTTGSGVDSLSSDNPLKTAILNLPALGDARSALDQLSGELHASAKTALIEDGHFVRDAETGRVREAFCAVAADGGATRSRTDTAADDGSRRSTLSDCTGNSDGFAAWGQGFGAWGHTNGDGNAARLSQSASGFFLGADASVFDIARVGVLGGYSRTTLTVNDRNSAGDSDDYHLGLYGGTQWEALGFRAGAAYSWHDMNTRRSVSFPGFADVLTGKYDARTAQLFGDLGYRIDAGSVAFEPFGDLAYVNLQSGGFTEQGGPAALTGQSGHTDTTFTTLGLRASTAFVLGDTETTMRGAAGWRQAFGDVDPASTVALAGSDSFDVHGVPIARSTAVIDFALDLRCASNLSLGVAYGGQFSGIAMEQNVRGALTIFF